MVDSFVLRSVSAWRVTKNRTSCRMEGHEIWGFLLCVIGQSFTGRPQLAKWLPCDLFLWDWATLESNELGQNGRCGTVPHWALLESNEVEQNGRCGAGPHWSLNEVEQNGRCSRTGPLKC